jgi:transposase-like protein
MQVYHANATTNIHIRFAIKQSNLPMNLLTKKYRVSENTILKLKHRESPDDRSPAPNTIHYALSALEQEIIRAIRRSSWLPLEEITEAAQQINPLASHSAVYRTLLKARLNKVPQQEKEKAKKFKAYEPGYLHIDVTYLPKIDEEKPYFFVAIDRAIRILLYKVYDAKTTENAEDFIKHCTGYFPFRFTHILTDNGLEFTNALLKSKNGKTCAKPSKVDELCKKESIEYRLTKPHTPTTNGMVE